MWCKLLTFCNFIILTEWCKIQLLNFDKAFLFPKNQVIFQENWKLWRGPTTIEFNIFCRNFAHVSVLPMSTKECLRFFLFCFFILSSKVGNVYKISTKIIKVYGSWSSSKFSIFYTKKICFSKTKRLSLNFVWNFELLN